KPAWVADSSVALMSRPKAAVLTTIAIVLIVATVVIARQSSGGSSHTQDSRAQDNGACNPNQPSPEEIKRFEDAIEPHTRPTVASILTAEHALLDLFVRPIEAQPLLQAVL